MKIPSSQAENIITFSVLQKIVPMLCQQDPDLKRVVENYGIPPIWKREEGFATLMHIILEQQVSLASAKAVFERICSICRPNAEDILVFGEDGLRSIGVTRQKAHYIVGAAQAEASGEIDFAALQSMSDDEVRRKLMQLKGVGAWTAEVYLLMALARADVFPSGDLALQIAAQGVKRLPKRPTADELKGLAEPWHPYRAVAARILWQWYLGTKERSQQANAASLSSIKQI